MALTFTKVPFANRFTGNGLTETIVDITFDSSYVTGGYVISPGKVGLKKIFGAKCIGVNGGGSLITNAVWDFTAGKLMAQQEVTNQLAQAGSGANLAAAKVRMVFSGI
jgi:hypothetical protein